MKKILLITALGLSFAFAGSVAPVNNALYQKECASCHFGYQPALLSKASWEKVMGNLSDHFGTDASLGKAESEQILSYLVTNAGSGKITANNTDMQITKSSYFIRKHREVSPKMIAQKEVGSIANCIACHTTADKGSYSERAIVIPNYGRWE
ncbi:diheme cytochrome c [Sulfurospirillum oryzae]|uniref:diheme cytochrome c n=1 Tax=Sulfurospirillum oryzae TaxID=2976535 RepID=UPI0021E6DA12|nr:diheme cytochrome c [Sulfurospirillum oryzae]